MFKNKKGSELSLNVIVLAAISILILVILIILVMNKTGDVIDNTSCQGSGRSCSGPGNQCDAGEIKVFDSGCKKSGEGDYCCIDPDEV